MKSPELHRLLHIKFDGREFVKALDKVVANLTFLSRKVEIAKLQAIDNFLAPRIDIAVWCYVGISVVLILATILR